MSWGIDRAVLVAAILALGFALAIVTGASPALPSCPEDAVIVGVGSFDHGQWSTYQCGPARDDYSERS